jgi:hypothetical protein
MRARHYDPTTGRFVSEDPARDGLNWFAYCDSNPVNRVDVEGRSWIAWFELMAGVAYYELFGRSVGSIAGKDCGYLYTALALISMVYDSMDNYNTARRMAGLLALSGRPDATRPFIALSVTSARMSFVLTSLAGYQLYLLFKYIMSEGDEDDALTI